MAYLATNIEAAVTATAAGLGLCRDLDGRLWAIRHDSTAGPAACALEYSDNNGVSWTAESWSDSIGAIGSAGGTDPVMMVTPDNNIWVGMSAFDGTTKPTFVKRIDAEQRWGVGGRIGEYHQLNVAGSTHNHFALDSNHRRYGYYNLTATYIDSSDHVGFADFFIGINGETVDSTGTCTESKIAITAGGTKHIVWNESSAAWWSYRVATTGAWSGRVKVSDAGHTVTSIEDIRIRPSCELPAVLYRNTDAGDIKLQLAEQGADGSWTQDRVWDAANTWDHYPGCSLGYDARGSVFISALHDYSGGGTAEIVTYEQVRALGVTSGWTAINRTTGSDGDSEGTFALSCHNPSIRGFRPNELYQGLVFVAFKYDASPATDDNLFFIDRDTFNVPASIYPSKYSQLAEEPHYRDEEEYTGATETLTGEGAEGTTYPLTDSVESYTVDNYFRTSVATFDGGYKCTIARYPSGRRVLSIDTVPLSAADKATLRTFLLARQADLVPFGFPDPEGGGDITVVMDQEITAPRKVGAGVWRMSFQLVEVM